MGVMIQDVCFHRIKRKLNKPFVTSLQTVTERESIIVTVRSESGLEGYGECVAFSTPWYTEETVESCAFVLKHVLKPLVLKKSLSKPYEVQGVFASVKGNQMAKAAIETAVWDLFAKQEGLPLWRYVGGVKKEIPAGVVVAANSENLMNAIDQAARSGYKRIKIKISPSSKRNLLKEAVRNYPDILFFADANGGFDCESFDQLKALDEVGFTLIEQPFGEEEWNLHARAKREMKTPICLDESISSFQDVERMIEMQAGDIVVLKMGRLGGWRETLKIVQLCREQRIGMWVGGMIEFGVSKAHNLALASLPDIELPGDFSDSGHFWTQDIVDPEIKVSEGRITLSDEVGIGFTVNMEEAEL